MQNKVVMQECTCCRKRFPVRYFMNGSYEYMGETCKCESDFEPIEGEPSISEWMEEIYMEEKVLTIFWLDKETRILLSGMFEIEKQEVDGMIFSVPVFTSLEGTLIDCKGNKKPFSPAGYSWDGNKYTLKDAADFFIENRILGNQKYKSVYLLPDLKKAVNTFQHQPVTTVCDQHVFPTMLHNGNIYSLVLATNKALYYGYDEDVVMVDTATRLIVSDNYFATEALDEVSDEVRAGRESLLYMRNKAKIGDEKCNC